MHISRIIWGRIFYRPRPMSYFPGFYTQIILKGKLWYFIRYCTIVGLVINIIKSLFIMPVLHEDH